MRLIIIADPLDNQSAGVHRVVWNMLDKLATDSGGHEIIIIREKKGEEGWPFKEIIIPNTRLPIGWASFRLFVLVPLLCRKLRADAVLEPAHFGPWNLPKSMKRITFIHDLTPIKFPHYHRWHSQLLQRVFLKGILKRADLVLTNSTSTAKDILDYCPTVSMVEAIHLGVDSRFEPVQDESVLDRYSLSRPYFLFTGTIEPRKNLTVLLSAYDLYRKGGGEATLVLVGGLGWKSREFLSTLRDHRYRKDILLTGFVPDEDLPAIYSGALAFVYPSAYEGFGLPVAEAMACGTPVITARNSSLIEIGGDAALFFETGDALGLSAKLADVENDPELSARAREQGIHQAAQFSWTNFKASFVEVLDRLSLGKKKKT